MPNTPNHIPVMLDEVIQALHLSTNQNAIDATVGLGGHSRAILQTTNPNGKLLGIDRTPKGAATSASNLKEFGSRVTISQGDFRDIKSIATTNNFQKVDAVLFDLGLASWQIDSGHKGLSFQKDEPLDMFITNSTNSNPQTAWTSSSDLAQAVQKWRFMPASDFVNNASEEELAIVFATLGDLNGKHIAQKITQHRKGKKILTTTDFKEALQSNNPKFLAPVFQSLRVLVNDEYGALTSGIYGAWDLLKEKGRLAIITFHSGEDRLVKKLLQTLPNASKQEKFFPSRNEISQNKRSRSAVLRVVEKVSATNHKNFT